MEIKPELQNTWAVLKPAMQTMIKCHLGLDEMAELFRKAYVETAIEQSKGNVSQAARMIRVHRNTMYRYTDKR